MPEGELIPIFPSLSGPVLHYDQGQGETSGQDMCLCLVSIEQILRASTSCQCLLLDYIHFCSSSNILNDKEPLFDVKKMTSNVL